MMKPLKFKNSKSSSDYIINKIMNNEISELFYFSDKIVTHKTIWKMEYFHTIKQEIWRELKDVYNK